MSKTAKKNYLKGAAILAMGGIIAKFLGMFFKIPLVRILGDFGVGLYGNAYPIYTFLLSVSIIGLPVAISKMVSERTSLGYYKEAYDVFKIALLTLSIIGAVCSLIMFFGANFFISLFKWHKDTYYSILGLSFAPFFVCIVSTFKGFFQGMQNMTPSSISQIVDSFGRVVIGLSLCIFLFTRFDNVALGAAGASFGATGGAFLTCIYLIIAFFVFKPKFKKSIKEQTVFKKETAKELLKLLIMISIPITLASLVTSAMNMINSFTVSAFLQKAGLTVEQATILWGQLSQKSQTLISIPMIFSSALAASLVPTISESFIKKDNEQIKIKTFLSMKVVFLLSAPCAVGLIVLAKPIITLLFGEPSGYGMLQLLPITILFAMLSTVLQAILQGIGKLKIPLRNLGIGCIIKLVLNIFLLQIPSLNIYGAIIGTIVADFFVAAFDYLAVKKYVGKTEGIFESIFKILLCATVMGFITHLSLSFLTNILGSSIATLISIIIAMIIYFGLVVLTKAFDINDIKVVLGR